MHGIDRPMGLVLKMTAWLRSSIDSLFLSLSFFDESRIGYSKKKGERKFLSVLLSPSFVFWLVGRFGFGHGDRRIEDTFDVVSLSRVLLTPWTNFHGCYFIRGGGISLSRLSFARIQLSSCVRYSFSTRFYFLAFFLFCRRDSFFLFSFFLFFFVLCRVSQQG